MGKFATLQPKKFKTMKEKFKKELIQKTKDLGLSGKAIDDLVALGVNGLADDASDEDITEKVDSLLPFAKAMQGEVTRKTQKSKQAKKKESEKDDDDDDADDEGKGDEIPKWAKAMQETLNSLKAENDSLKAEKAKAQRKADISAEAKKLGIPEYLMKRITIADDADITKELTEFKQELVNNSLLHKGAPVDEGKKEEAMKADAESWAKSLPDK